MEPALAFLDASRDFDTVSLARSTEVALGIIVPWCRATELDSRLIPTSITREIEKQARVYAKAIDFSVAAAQDGFTVAEEALALVEYIEEATPEERKDFLLEMRKFSRKGREKASEAHERFVGVGRTIQEILSDMRKEGAKAGRDCDRGNDSSKELQLQLEHGMTDLEKFRDVLSKFVAWWNEMEMESNTQLTRESMMIQKFNSLRLKSIEAKWKDHRKRYAAYVDEIGRIQDRFPDIFTKTLSRQDRLQDSPREIQEPPPAYKPDVVDSPPSFRGPGLGQNDCNNVFIFSEELSSASYMSASLSTVQTLEPNKCLLVMHFQCHPSETRRFTSLRINWRLRSVGGARVPKVLDIAPKQSIGARNEERHKWMFGIGATAKFAALGGELGPEFNQSWEINKSVTRAMVITGSTRGLLPDAAQWSVTENSSAKSGIPAHFQVAIVIEYGGIFMMELDVVAKQLGNNRWWNSRNHVKAELPVDVNGLHGGFQPYGPPRGWRQWFPLFKSEIEGGTVEHNFQPLAAYNS